MGFQSGQTGQGAKNFSIESIRLDLTSACNQACVFCPFNISGVHSDGVRHLAAAQITKVLGSLRSMNIKVKFRLVGMGEPTIHPDFLKVSRMIVEEEHSLKMITNGLFSGNLVNSISGVFQEVVFSIHGPPATHDWATGVKGSFSRAMNNIERLRKNDSAVSILMNAVCSRETVDDLPQLVKIAFDMNIKLRIQFVLDESGIDYSTEEVEKILSVVERIMADTTDSIFVPNLAVQEIPTYFNFSKSHFRTPFVCKQYTKELCIACDGEVSLCRFPRIGNITNRSLESILESKRLQDVVGLLNRVAMSEISIPKECSRCCMN